MSFSCYHVLCDNNLFSIRRSKQKRDLIPLAGGFILRCAQFSYAYTVRLTLDGISENQVGLPLRVTSGFQYRFPGGCVVAQVAEMGSIHPDDLF